MDSLVNGFLMNFFFCMLRMTFSEGLNYFKGQKLILKVNKTDNENLYWLLGICGSEWIFSVVYSKISSAMLSLRDSNQLYFNICLIYIYIWISSFRNY